ncbi:hypothetical protein [Xanthomonas albilineans]|uniref:HvfA family oxazolone/thioamide-modified RiPP metallophore n=1 Tax=Xanthomonas albilineans TaxID=29447 RepID=UPI0005F35995|nr:hypothetical protein [Xanthomonas albilineans]
MPRSPRPFPALAGAALLGGLSLSASALAMTDLPQGYALGAQPSTPPQTEDTATPPSATPTPPATHAKDTVKATEGKCGAHADSKQKASHATNKHNGKAMTEGKCGEGKCGGGG